MRSRIVRPPEKKLACSKLQRGARRRSSIFCIFFFCVDDRGTFSPSTIVINPRNQPLQPTIAINRRNAINHIAINHRNQPSQSTIAINHRNKTSQSTIATRSTIAVNHRNIARIPFVLYTILRYNSLALGTLSIVVAPSFIPQGQPFRVGYIMQFLLK